MTPFKALRMAGKAPRFYWRVRCTARAGGSVYVIGEIEFIATPGGADITPVLSAPDARCIASSYYASINTPQWKAFDSNVNTIWANDPGDTNPWVGWNFGVNQPLYSVKIKSGTTSSFQQPSAGAIEYSADGTNWTTAATFTHTWADNQTLEVLIP